MAQLGFRTIEEMVGRVDRLEARKAVDHWKAKGLDFSKILYQPDVDEDGRALLPDPAGPLARQVARCHDPPRHLPPGDRAR